MDFQGTRAHRPTEIAIMPSLRMEQVVAALRSRKNDFSAAYIKGPTVITSTSDIDVVLTPTKVSAEVYEQLLHAIASRCAGLEDSVFIRYGTASLFRRLVGENDACRSLIDVVFASSPPLRWTWGLDQPGLLNSLRRSSIRLWGDEMYPSEGPKPAFAREHVVEYLRANVTQFVGLAAESDMVLREINARHLCKLILRKCYYLDASRDDDCLELDQAAFESWFLATHPVALHVWEALKSEWPSGDSNSELRSQVMEIACDALSREDA